MDEDVKVHIEIPDCIFETILKRIRKFTIAVGEAMGDAMSHHVTVAIVDVEKQSDFTVNKVTEALEAFGAIIYDQSTEKRTHITIDFANFRAPF